MHFKLIAIKNIFPKATNFVCSWHVQQNLKKKFCYLNRAKNKASKDLYVQIINLPYSNYPQEFEEDISEIYQSKLISSELKKYLKDKAKEKQFWVKGFMKIKFCCGMCSTSRIESKHRTLKKFLNSGMRLIELFKIVKELEKKEVSRMENEIEKSGKIERKKKDKSDLILNFKDDYSEYIIERLKDNLIESTNYKIVQAASNSWSILSISLSKIIRFSIRNEKQQKLTLANGKVSCSCGDLTFCGIQCRHLVALVCKVDSISYKNLVFNPRWKKNYFVEDQLSQEPDELKEEEKKESYLELDVSYESESGEKTKNEEIIQAFDQVSY